MMHTVLPEKLEGMGCGVFLHTWQRQCNKREKQATHSLLSSNRRSRRRRRLQVMFADIAADSEHHHRQRQHKRDADAETGVVHHR